MQKIKLNVPVKSGSSYKNETVERSIFCDLNTLTAIQNRYGDVKAMFGKVKILSELVWVITLMLNEASEYEAFAYAKPATMLTEKQVGLMIPFGTIQDGSLGAALSAAVIECVGNSEKKMTAEAMMAMMTANFSEEEKSETAP